MAIAVIVIGTFSLGLYVMHAVDTAPSEAAKASTSTPSTALAAQQVTTTSVPK